MGLKCNIFSPEETYRFKTWRALRGAKRKLISDGNLRYNEWLNDFVRNLDKRADNIDDSFNVINAQDVVAFNILSRKGKNKDIPCVLTLHGYYVDEMISVGSLMPNSPTTNRLLNMEISAYSEADRIVAVDKRIKEYVIKKVPDKAESISVIQNAVDVDLFKPSDEVSYLKSRNKFNIPRKSKVLLCARRLVPKNGVSVAVQAMPEILKHFPEALLVIAGDGPLNNELRRLTSSLGIARNVLFLGSVPHKLMPTLYAATDLVLVPSIHSVNVEEATSITMLEGMSAGKPLIASSIGGIKEVIKHGENGLLTKEGDCHQLADSCVDLLMDESRRIFIGTRARDYVIKNHSHFDHARKFIIEYEKVCN